MAVVRVARAGASAREGAEGAEVERVRGGGLGAAKRLRAA